MLLAVGAACGAAVPNACPKVAPKPKPVVQDQLLTAKQQVEELVLGAYEQQLIDASESGARIPIHVAATSTNFDEDRPFAVFIGSQTSAYLSDQVKLSVQPEMNTTVAGLLEQHVIATRDAGGNLKGLALLAVLKDARSGAVLASTILPVSDVARSQEYLAFKTQFTPDSQPGVEARIRIEGVNISKGFETLERVSQSEYTESSSGSAQASGSGSYSGSRRSGHGSGSGSVSGTKTRARADPTTAISARAAGTRCNSRSSSTGPLTSWIATASFSTKSCLRARTT